MYKYKFSIYFNKNYSKVIFHFYGTHIYNYGKTLLLGLYLVNTVYAQR